LSVAHAQAANALQEQTLAEVVVTAEKRTVSLQKTNVAASALGTAELEKKSITDLAGLQNATPSMTVIDQGFSKSINIRGIGLAVQSPEVAVGVATYRDGLFLPTNTSLGNVFYDLQDVQVLRGPQGTYAGTAATGGAIYMNSKSPVIADAPSGDISVAYGNYADVLVAGGVNLPVNDKLAARVAFHVEDRSSFYNDISPTANGLHPGKVDTKNVRVGLLWSPTDALSVIFKTEYDKFSNDGYAYQPIPGTGFVDAAPQEKFVINYDQQGLRFDLLYIPTSLNINYKFEDGISIKSVTGYQYIDINAFYDLDGSPVPFQTLSQVGAERVWTEDFSIVSPDTGAFKWVVGGTYFDYRLPLTLNVGVIPADLNVGVRLVTKKQSLGLFASGTYNITPTVDIQAGVRVSNDKVSTVGGTTFSIKSLGATVGFQSADSGHFDDDTITGKLAVNWNPNSENLVYAFVAKGYKAGGTNGTNGFFKPEIVYDYELGWKSSFLDDRLRTQIGAFNMDYKDFQVQAFSPPIGDTNVTNASSTSKIKGFEAQAQLQLGGFGADGSISYVDSSIGSLPSLVDERSLPNGSAQGLGGQCTAPGVPTPCFNYAPYIQPVPSGPNVFSPKWTASVGLQYALNVGRGELVPRIDASYLAEQFATIFEAPIDRLKARSLVNLRLSYSLDDWVVQAYGTNVFDKTYVAGFTANLGANYILTSPRQYGVRVTRNF
jgi:iron complex outermembrane receptor protein